MAEMKSPHAMNLEVEGDVRRDLQVGENDRLAVLDEEHAPALVDLDDELADAAVELAAELTALAVALDAREGGSQPPQTSERGPFFT